MTTASLQNISASSNNESDYLWIEWSITNEFCGMSRMRRKMSRKWESEANELRRIWDEFTNGTKTNEFCEMSEQVERHCEMRQKYFEVRQMASFTILLLQRMLEHQNMTRFSVVEWQMVKKSFSQNWEELVFKQ